MSSNEVNQCVDDLLRAARTIGSDESLVLLGGGNCSVKLHDGAAYGVQGPVLLVKGSGHDMSTLSEDGLAPLDLQRLRSEFSEGLIDQGHLPDALRALTLRDGAPAPSVESLVHAVVPHRYVLHSHADISQAITDTGNADNFAREAWGKDVLVIDYASPGVPLGTAFAEAISKSPEADSAVVIGHGIFTFADTADDALSRHLQMIDQAHAFVSRKLSDDSNHELFADARVPNLRPEQSQLIAELRAELSEIAGRPLILTLAVPETDEITSLIPVVQRGPATPDHVTWVGPWVVADRDVNAYGAKYREYVDKNARRTHRDDLLDGSFKLPTPYPRAVLLPGVGIVAAGRTITEAKATGQIARHTLRIAQIAERLDSYRPPTDDHIFDLEYWRPQMDKYTRRDDQRPDLGRVVLVTGAASGIGRACAEEYLARGANVVAWDRSESVVSLHDDPSWFGQIVDVTDEQAQGEALAKAVEQFGGLDVLVVAAGIFPSTENIVDMEKSSWERAMAVNTTSVAVLMRLTHPYLANASGGGYVCVIASKNVPAPGFGAAAYSSSKAALVQLSRVAALEWAADGIRVNMLHPDAVFDTALWTPELLKARAEHYGMSVEDYKRRNLLHAEVTSAKVGELAAVTTSSAFSCTTGAQIPIDGGNERVI